MIRGGYWLDLASSCRSAVRLWMYLMNRSHTVGFRVALPASPPIATPSETPTPTPETIAIPLPGLSAAARPMRLVRIPSGSFLMGSNPDERNRIATEGDEEDDKHPVTIGYDFYIGETEITQAQWKAVTGRTIEDQRDLADPTDDLIGFGDDYPVYFVSWDEITEASGFLDRLDSLAGLSGFRLPSEAEWEYVCRGGTDTRFFFGNSDSMSCSDSADDCAAEVLGGNMTDYMWYLANNNPYGIKEVGQKRANPFGLLDIHGNVFELCEDSWHASYWGAPADGSSWNAVPSDRHIIRGGCWGSGAHGCRSASRDGMWPANRVTSWVFELSCPYL